MTDHYAMARRSWIFFRTKPFSRSDAATQSRSNAGQISSMYILTGNCLGLLINFDENLIKDGFKRVANGLDVF